MRRPSSALTLAVLGTALAATTLTAQQAPPAAPRGGPASAAGNPPMAASRGPRFLLRNGRDYLDTEEYELALHLFREAEKRQGELTDAEKSSLKQGIDAARRGMRETPNRVGRSYPLSGAAARPGTPPGGLGPDGVVLTGGTAPLPALPRGPVDREIPGSAPAPVAAPAPVRVAEPPPLALAAVASPDGLPPAPEIPAAPDSAAEPLPPLPDMDPLPSAPPLGPPGAAEATPAVALAKPAPPPEPEPLPPLPEMPEEPEARPAPEPPALPPPAESEKPEPVPAPEAVKPEPAPEAVKPEPVPAPAPEAAPPEPAPAPEAEKVAPVPTPAPVPVAPRTPQPAPAPVVGRRARTVAPVEEPIVPPRAELGESTLSPELQREVDKIAQKMDEETKNEQNQPKPTAGADPAAPPRSNSERATGLDVTRPPSPTEARPLKPIPVPEDFVPMVKRDWSPNRKYWAASAVCHMPLYFQDAALERYGHSTEQFVGPVGRCLSYPIDDPRQSNQRNQLTQPFFSIGLFALQTALLPYNLIMDPPWEAEYDLGYYRPGDRVPTDVIYLPYHGVGPPLQGKNY